MERPRNLRCSYPLLVLQHILLVIGYQRKDPNLREIVKPVVEEALASSDLTDESSDTSRLIGEVTPEQLSRR